MPTNRVLILALLLSPALPAGCPATAEPGMQPGAAHQVAQLQQIRSTKTEDERKIASRLYLARLSVRAR